MSIQIDDWDAAYSNMAHIPNSETYPPMWAKRGEHFRKTWPFATLDIAYGAAPRNRLDLFMPSGRPEGVVVFVHGGFWMRLDKSYWSAFANGSLQRGWAVAIPSYTLAPEIRIAGITEEIAHALSAVSAQVDVPMHLVGHSAGGHLVMRMITATANVPSAVRSKIKRVVSISGLHQLHPLMNTQMNQILQLDTAECDQESVAHLSPVSEPSICAWVGGGELPEFIRQSTLLSESWPQCSLVVDAQHHHFSVIEGLCDPHSALTQNVLGN